MSTRRSRRRACGRPGSSPARAAATPVELEIVGKDLPAGDAGAAAAPELRRAATKAIAAAGVDEGHVAVALVSEPEMRRLNRDHRGSDAPTDVLSFPVDGRAPAPGPRELGDVVICPPRAESLTEAVVHGVLHLLGYDHETDGGEMLALQDRVMAELG